LKKFFLVWALVTILLSVIVNAVYDVPADKRIIWSAGLDSEGGIPNYPSVTCAGAVGDGVQEAGAAIQACINSAAAQTAVYLPAGTYKASTTISMKSNVVLRGAGPGNTLIKLYNGAYISFSGGGSSGSNIDIVSGYGKDSTVLTLASTTGLAANDYVSIFQDDDPSIVDASKCSWCGEDNGLGHNLQQYSKITAVNGNQITISPGLYYGMSPAFNPQVKEVGFSLSKAGLEDLKIELTTNTGYMVRSRSSRNCWIKNIESYNGGASSGNAHVRLEFSYGWEVRDSYFHDGHGYGSGQNYGFWLLYWNSNHKVENNIFYSVRHGVNFEGGGSGCAILYNFFDGGKESEDLTFLSADLNPNHGPHPHMNLYEGNVAAKITQDYTMGSSSHNVAFRNWARGYRSNPSFSWGVWAIDTQKYNRYMSFVGNVVGMPNWSSGTVIANGNADPSGKTAFRFGGTGEPGSYGDALAFSTAILHANYDYITDGVANWDGGSDHVLKSSMYYASKPAFFGNVPWPAIGPDVTGYANKIPAQIRYEQINSGGVSCIDTDQDRYGIGCAAGNDCNDNNANIRPGATEVCGNGIDEDCSGADLACSGVVPGDLNSDNRIDIADLVIIATNFGKTGGFDSRADVVKDGMIDISDLVYVAIRFS